MRKFNTTALLKDKEVSLEHYEEMIGCVPPERMTINAFLVGEASDYAKNMSGNFTERFELYFMENGKAYFGGLASVSDFDAFLLPTESTATLDALISKAGNLVDYRDILRIEIAKELDTDHGILKAYWSTLKILIDLKEKSEAMKLAQEMGKNYGEFKLTEAMGDIYDAGLITK